MWVSETSKANGSKRESETSKANGSKRVSETSKANGSKRESETSKANCDKRVSETSSEIRELMNAVSFNNLNFHNAIGRRSLLEKMLSKERIKKLFDIANLKEKHCSGRKMKTNAG